MSAARRTVQQGLPEKPFALKLTLPDGILLVVSALFLILAFLAEASKYGEFNLYLTLRGTHHHLSRYGLVVGGIMAAIAAYIGFYRKADVTPWFRRGAYVVFGTMFIQALIGFGLWLGFGTQPGQPEHIIYGIATAACLPFFIFVEVTSRKRPAMGSYIWGFVLLLGVIVRAIGTGPTTG